LAEALQDDEKEIWGDPEVVVLREQPATAVYWNKMDQLVIRQKSLFGEDDACVYVAQYNLVEFIDKLADAAGIPGVGKKRR